MKNRSTYYRAKRIINEMEKHYEPENLIKCKANILRNKVVELDGISYRTLMRYQKINNEAPPPKKIDYRFSMFPELADEY
ncbi:MAG: hypothetical protein LBN95_07095 [Prevotellaceae bacterium]|nr:hypothetical protein [Prevotellaceae bacterium]